MFWYLAGAVCVCTLSGGLIAWRYKTHHGFVLAFCAGALIAGALGEMPELLEMLGAPTESWRLWGMLVAYGLGFLGCAVLDHTVPFGPTRAAGFTGLRVSQLGLWIAVAIGLPSVLDGIALGQAAETEPSLGWLVTSSVLLHKLADGVSTVGIMLGTQQTLRATQTALGIAATTPVAGLLGVSWVPLSPPVLGLFLACFAGMFLYLGLLTFWPAARAVSASRYLPLVVLAGATFIGGIQWLGT